LLQAAVSVALGGKVLKIIINQSRPTNIAPDPGMPSSHATSLSFLSVYLCCTWIPQQVHDFGSPLAPFLPEAMFSTTPESNTMFRFRTACAMTVMACASVLTGARVISGHHTWPQVYVGGAYGTLCALVWFHIFSTPCVHVLEHFRKVQGETFWKAFVLICIALGPVVMGPISHFWKKSFSKKIK
jgi:dolichyldiphosphatase